MISAAARVRAAVVATVVAAAVLTACDAGTGGDATHSTPATRPSTVSTQPSTSHHPTHTSRPTTRPPRSPRHTTATSSSSAAAKPVIVIDPGHSVTIHATDPSTGLDVSDYANEPEMHDVFAVALRVRAKLEAAGYRVVLTKPTLDTPTSLGRRAHIANALHAALALSIHDEAGGGGVGFRQGNNIVYYQSVGNYRETPSGKKIYFTDAAVAALSKRYAEIFQAKRAAAQGVPMQLLGNTGYDLGTRGLPAGNIWLVQLLSHVPWIYNEAGGNSAGQSGLDNADEQTYADGLVAAVEACIPLPR